MEYRLSNQYKRIRKKVDYIGLPGMASLSLLEIRTYGVEPECEPEKFIRDGKPNYWYDLHYATEEIDMKRLIALAELATRRMIVWPEEEPA